MTGGMVSLVRTIAWRWVADRLCTIWGVALLAICLVCTALTGGVVMASRSVMAWPSLMGWCSTVGEGITTPDGGTGTGAGGSARRTPEEGPGASACAINVALDVCPCANDAAVNRPMPSARQGMPIFKSGSSRGTDGLPMSNPLWPRVSARAFWLQASNDTRAAPTCPLPACNTGKDSTKNTAGFTSAIARTAAPSRSGLGIHPFWILGKSKKGCQRRRPRFIKLAAMGTRPIGVNRGQRGMANHRRPMRAMCQHR
jgi:hypothetical protein